MMVYKIHEENGTPGVVVTLYDNTGAVVARDTTDSNGNYLFEGVPSGDYSLGFELPAGNAWTKPNKGNDNQDSDVNPNTGRTPLFTLSPGENDNSQDAGTLPLGSIGDMVWDDADGDGLQDLGENGLPGIVVTLYDNMGGVLAKDTTDASGNYLFDGLFPGNYTIEYALPSGKIFSPKDQGSNDAKDSDVDPVTGRTPTVNLLAGEDRTDVDAGLVDPASISDFVWKDMDGDGIQDPGETGLPGAIVTLYDDMGNVIAKDTTDANGNYSFDDLLPGDYSIGVDLPMGYTHGPQDQGTDDAKDSDINPNTGVSAPFTLNAGQDKDDVDAAALPNGGIGDLVWEDTDGDGVQDPGETGVPGAIVTLYDDMGNMVAKDTTDANGNYNFDDVPAGDYTIGVDLPSGYTHGPQDQGGDDTKDSDINPNTGVSSPFTVNPGQNKNDVDAAALPNGHIGDRVWDDADGDGIQDPGENGLPGAIVTLYDNMGAVVAKDTTDSNGNYLFEDVPPGDYSIGFDLPGNKAFSPKDQGTNDAVDSDPDPATGRTPVFTLDPGENKDDVDAGAADTGVIGDRVWDDQNGNGVQNSGEPGLPGVVVTLYDNNGAVVARDTTDGNGNYEFRNVPAGSYTIGFDNLPDGYVFTPQGGTPDTRIDSDPNPNTGRTSPFVLNPGQRRRDVDAGLVPPGSIGDRVWKDTNGNGIQDPTESGLGGVIVRLYDCAGTLIATDTSDANGDFSFGNVPVGRYYLDFDPNGQPGCVFSPQGAGSNTALDSDADANGRTPCFDVNPGQDKDDVDAGLMPLANIGDKVFDDLDGDGIQDSGEKGIAGVIVKLYDNMGTLVATDTTDANGNYRFDDVLAGDYVLEFSNVPGGMVFSPKDQGSDDAVDSDVNPANGRTDVFTVSAGVTEDTKDAGLTARIPITYGGIIGDRVWEDYDRDGIQDAIEPGVSGIVVKLYDGQGSLVGTDSTDAGGYYAFNNLPPGDYVLEFSNLPPSMNIGAKDQGANDYVDSDADPATGKTDLFYLNPNENAIYWDAALEQASCRVHCDIDNSLAGFSFLFTHGTFPGTSDYEFDANGGLIETFADGSAHITGKLVNQTDNTKRWDVDVWLMGRKDWGAWSAAGGSFKGDSAGFLYTSWDYYVVNNARSYLYGDGSLAGDTLYLTHFPANGRFGFQYGQGANGNLNAFSLWGWFAYTSASGKYTGRGDFIADLDCNSGCSFPPMLAIAAFLEGNYNASTGQMGQLLNARGFIPGGQPYNTTPWNYRGTESVTSMPTTEVLDWVLIELRDANDPKIILDRMAAFLRTNGEVVGMDGHALMVPDLPTGTDSFYVALIHRNHLAVMSATPVKLTGRVFFADLTRPGMVYEQNNFTYDPAKQIVYRGQNRVLLYQGDESADQLINSLDMGSILQQYFLIGHEQGDINLDGVVNSLDVARAYRNYFIRSHIPK